MRTGDQQVGNSNHLSSPVAISDIQLTQPVVLPLHSSFYPGSVLPPILHDDQFGNNIFGDIHKTGDKLGHRK
jgi:hypothetical protein